MSEILAHDRRGDGPPLVLIHGLGGTRRIWRPQLDALAREREVVAIDMPGFGDSPPLPAARPATAAALGAEIGATLDALGIDEADLAGNSLGGWVALEMARAGRARSLCLISPAGLWRRPLGPRSFDARGAAARLRPLLPLVVRSAAVRRRALAGNVARPDRVPRADALAMIRSWLDAAGYDAANEQMRSAVFEDPASIRVPTTIAWGEHDRLVAPPQPERRPPASRFLVLPGCGHVPNWDDPELVTRLLLEASEPAPARLGVSP
jgi:pimeloyl-ACP methyl ester carboxylesterase